MARIPILMQNSKADIHIHTNYSDSKASVLDVLQYVICQTDLKVIAITDHDTIEGALLARKLVKKYQLNLEVILGEEISSTDGHIIGLFLTKKIKPGLSARQTLFEIKRQKGIAVTSHPFYQTGYKNNGRVIGGIGFDEVKKNIDLIDALEVVNGNLIMYPFENKKAKKINQTSFNFPEVGGSDSHFLAAIGKSYTLFPGNSAADFRQSLIENNTTAVQGRWDIKSVLIYTIYISISILSFALFVTKIKLNELNQKINKIFFNYRRFNNDSDCFDPLYQPGESKHENR